MLDWYPDVCSPDVSECGLKLLDARAQHTSGCFMHGSNYRTKTKSTHASATPHRRTKISLGSLLQLPAIQDVTLLPTEPVLSMLGTPQDLLKRMTPVSGGLPDSWLVLATVQLLHAAAGPLLFAVVDDTCEGRQSTTLLHSVVEPVFSVRLPPAAIRALVFCLFGVCCLCCAGSANTAGLGCRSGLLWRRRLYAACPVLLIICLVSCPDAAVSKLNYSWPRSQQLAAAALCPCTRCARGHAVMHTSQVSF
jgi:hypothetical protein